jgi:hypothetical protein
LQFSSPDIPLRIYFEGRHTEENKTNSRAVRASDEGVATIAFSGRLGSSDKDSLAASWYGEVAQVTAVSSKDYVSGSAWFRLSSVSIGIKPFQFVMDPLDAFAYRECLGGCRGWVFAGIGLSLNYSSDLFSISIRGNLGERFDADPDERVRARDSARLLLVAHGEL